jgi:urease accessory protein
MTGVADCRRPEQIGRQARLELVFAERHGRTVLAHAYAEPPYRVAPGFEHPFGLHVIVASSAPGIFGGDALEQTIVVERGARVLLTSQSAVQLHPHQGGQPARLDSTYRVDDGGLLRCEWEPLIPFGGAALDQRVTIELAGEARLAWTDALMTGRVGRGERWQLTRLAHELRVKRAGELEYLERYVLRPAEQPLTARWIAGGADYLGTGVSSGVPDARQRAARLQHQLAQVGSLQAAADALHDSLLAIRVMSGCGVAFHRAAALIRRTLCD